jgi:hypothetical protein
MPNDLDRKLSGLTKFIRKVMGSFLITQVDYLAAYKCKVVFQNGDGTLELQPDDPRIPPLSNVPIFYGIPGVTATIKAGSRVLLEFANGDPSNRIATVWEKSSVSELVLTADTVTVNATTVTVGSGSSSVSLGAAGALVAREGDQVIGTAGPYPIIAQIGPPTGNTQVKA